MRKVVFGGANSLDNYFARKDGGMDWLLWTLACPLESECSLGEG